MCDSKTEMYRKQQLTHYMKALKKAQALENKVMDSYGFYLDKKYKYLYSDERVLFTAFCNASTQEEQEAIAHELYNHLELINDVIKDFRIRTNVQASEELFTMLKEADSIRLKEYEHLCCIGSLLLL